MRYALNYSGTRFLSTTELLNFLMDSVLSLFKLLMLFLIKFTTVFCAAGKDPFHLRPFL